MSNTKQQEVEVYSTYDTVDEMALAERRVAIAKDYSIEPESIKFVDSLPKTRSGKIMRRVLKARAQGLDEGDLSTIEE